MDEKVGLTRLVGTGGSESAGRDLVTSSGEFCSVLVDALKRFAWGASVGLACTDSVATVVRVDGTSMQPTLNPGVGHQAPEWVLVEKLSYKWRHKYSRGDVAVLW